MSSIEVSNYSYKKWNIDNNILHNINGLLFPFDKSYKSIGVNLSGGADSALGTAVLCSLIEKYKTETKITVITNIRVWKSRPWQAPIALDVYNKIREMFPNVKFERVENYIAPELEHDSIGKIEQLGTTGDRVITRSFNEYISHAKNLEAIYTFITHNPTDENFICSCLGRPLDRYLDKEEIDNADFCPQIDPHNIKLQRPWMFVQKDFIMSTYIENNWVDLLKTTRSCEGDFAYLNYKNYKHGVTPLKTCDECFWCVERKWGWEKATND